jgi:hypothetical protein
VDDEEPNWQRQLAVGLGVLLAIGVLIGAVVAVVAVKAADYAGLGDSSTGRSTPEPILPSTAGAVTDSPPTKTPHSSPPSSSRSQKPPSQQHAIRLAASPPSAGSYERVNLTGTYPGHDGATLQVQRSLGSGAWSDFPTTAHVSGGRFATYIQTGMTGVNHFRMLDQATGKTSNVATVTIG